MAAEQLLGDEAALSKEWRRWIAENKMEGLDDQALVDILIQNGIEPQAAWEALYAVTSHPYFLAGDAMAQKVRKLESILGVHRDLNSLLPSARYQTIERRSNVPREEFLERYYAANRPVILLNLMNDWKARSLWNPEYLRETCGNEMVEIMSGRDGDPRYEVNSDSHRSTIRFSEYIDRTVRGGKSNDCYLVANNNLLERGGMGRLYEDIVLFPEYLDSSSRAGCVFFWFGPSGTVTPLHHDLLNIFMAQVCGRKRVTLISSDQTPLVYNEVGVYSEVDPEKPAYDKFPRFRNVQLTRFVLRPGEVLFLPVGWWHRVEALDISITISLSNFLFNNEFKWCNPEVSR